MGYVALHRVFIVGSERCAEIVGLVLLPLLCDIACARPIKLIFYLEQGQ